MKRSLRNVAGKVKFMGIIEMEDLKLTIIIAGVVFFVSMNPILLILVIPLTLYLLIKLKSGRESGALDHLKYAYLGLELPGYLPPIKKAHKYLCVKLKNKNERFFNEQRRPVSYKG